MNINERNNADLLGKIYRKTGIGSRFMEKEGAVNRYFSSLKVTYIDSHVNTLSRQIRGIFRVF